MNKANVRQWLLFKFMAVFLMFSSSGFIYQVYLFTERYNTKSLIIHGDIIQFDGKVLISLGGVPILIWTFFFALRLLLKKGAEPLEKSTYIGTAWGIFSMGTVLLGFIASFIIPFILMASPYTYCDVDTRSSYYAIRPELCETITVDHGVKKRKNTGGVSSIK